MKVIFLGATKGIGRSLSRLMVERGDELFLLGRDSEDVKRSARDLEQRSSRPEQPIAVGHCDLANTETIAEALESAFKALGHVDAVVVTAALFGTQEALEADSARTQALLQVNFVSTILFCEEARKRLLKQGGGTLCVLSSVAGDAARKPVILYGATKAGLTHYLNGLDHKFKAAGLHTVCIKPGFVKTSMTAGLPVPPFAGEPEAVAKDILRAIDHKTPNIYTPSIWRWVMLVIQHLPRFVMRKISF